MYKKKQKKQNKKTKKQQNNKNKKQKKNKTKKQQQKTKKNIKKRVERKRQCTGTIQPEIKQTLFVICTFAYFPCFFFF